MNIKYLFLISSFLIGFNTLATDVVDRNQELIDLITPVFPYQILPANGCPSSNQFGKGHFGSGSGPLASCPGSTSSTLGFERIYRGGFPSLEGINCLRSLGVTAIFDLRTESTARNNNEQAIAIEAGMQYFSFPMEVMTATPGSQACARDRLNSTQCNQRSLIGFIQAIRQYLYQNPNAKVYVHCARGQDRTGLAMGFFRVKVQGCSKENAREEMLSYRFNPTIPLQTIWDHIDQINP